MNNTRNPSARYTLKNDGTFLVADELGDVAGERDGLFCADTRFLSRFAITIGGAAPSLLSSGVSQDNVIFRANLTNRPLPELGGVRTPEGVIHIERTRLLWDSRLFERITLTNYGNTGVLLPLQFAFAADFADIFEVRGYHRTRPGTLLPPAQDAMSVTHSYRGRDDVVRACVVSFSRPPAPHDGPRSRSSPSNCLRADTFRCRSKSESRRRLPRTGADSGTLPPWRGVPCDNDGA